MIVERLILKEYNWAITILLECNCSDIPEILEHLQSISCPQNLQEEAINNLSSCDNNIGLTYSNFKLGRTIMIINHTSNNAELINTITHECYHFIQHIANANNITDEETLASLTGRFNMQLWDTVCCIINGSN